jgi:hypothetical protein
MDLEEGSIKSKPEAKKTEELPALDDLLQCFTAEGIFNKKHMSLLRGFLTADSLALLDTLLASIETNEQAYGYILTMIA